MPQFKENLRKGSMDSWIANAKKEICKCCRKELGLLVGNIAMFRGKCQVCRQKICSNCVASSLCHKCRVKRYVKLNPTDLMQLSGKKLTDIATTLHFHNPQGYEKSELVQLILAIYGLKWTRPIPPPPSTTSHSSADSEMFGRCQHCDKLLSDADSSGVLCARCEASRSTTYEPDDLMQLSAKGLQDILISLNVPESEACVREKGELVMLILKTIGKRPDWRPPIPRQPSTRPRSIDSDSPANLVIPPETGNSSVPASAESLSSPTAAQNPSPVVDWSGRPFGNENPRSSPDASAGENDEQRERPSLSRVSSLGDIPNASVIQDLKVPQLKSLLQKYMVDIEGCCEKKDLADQVALLYASRIQAGEGEAAVNANPDPTINQRQTTDAPEEASHPGEGPSADPARGNGNDSKSRGGVQYVMPEEVPCLREIPSIEALAALSNRQLKILLHKHKVEYSKCRERNELLQRVTELWKDVTKWSSAEAIPDEDVCKICMDAPIDCVMLDCGHMVACTECGRQMSECPVCRQYVVRVVHIFKA